MITTEQPRSLLSGLMDAIREKLGELNQPEQVAIGDTGYMTNAQGHLIPTSKVQELDLKRDQLVKDIVHNALSLQLSMADFKQQSQAKIDEFIHLAAKEYGATLGGKKGNMSLSSFDGRYTLKIAINDSLDFDERLQIAKSLIDECIHEWTANSGDEVRALIEHAFQTDKEGNINTARVLGLFKLKITHPKWLHAMTALKDSMHIASSKSYIRLYERVGAEGKQEQISLDIAAL
jgi:hypothetical protein